MQEISAYLRTISERLKKHYDCNVILYGSYAKGDATEDSDIDLLIIASTKEKFFERMATVRRILRDLRQGIPISPIVFTREEINQRKSKGDQFIQDILDGGVEL